MSSVSYHITSWNSYYKCQTLFASFCGLKISLICFWLQMIQILKYFFVQTDLAIINVMQTCFSKWYPSTLLIFLDFHLHKSVLNKILHLIFSFGILVYILTVSIFNIERLKSHFHVLYRRRFQLIAKMVLINLLSQFQLVLIVWVQ